MKSDFVELIRKILIKTWLPLQKKKEAFAGKIKFSIINKISLVYFKNMLIIGVVFWALIQLLYLMSIREEYDREAKTLLAELEQLENSGDVELIHNQHIYNETGSVIYISVSDAATGELVFERLPEKFNIDDNKLIGGFCYIGEEDKDGYALVLRYEKKIENGYGQYDITLYYDMTRQSVRLEQVLSKIAVCYLLAAVFIAADGMKASARLFNPIREMSEAAGRLTVNNLGSERLNVEGTKDELKELAVVINDMLDRMDVSYESQKQFVSDASHELRTPIAVIQGYVNMLNRWGAKDPDILAESIDALKNEAEAMQDLVEKLLFLSRHDKKTLKLKKKKFNAAPLIEEIFKETQMVAKERIVECPAMEDVYLYGDKQSIKQAVRVFIDNAVKYSKEGDKVIVSCRNQNGDCVIEVADTGIGMKKRDLDNIFNRFYRADDVRNKKIDGHGLGLSIAKLIITAHAGRIKIRTQYTKGTSFKITFPKPWYVTDRP